MRAPERLDRAVQGIARGVETENWERVIAHSGEAIEESAAIAGAVAGAANYVASASKKIDDAARIAGKAAGKAADYLWGKGPKAAPKRGAPKRSSDAGTAGDAPTGAAEAEAAAGRAAASAGEFSVFDWTGYPDGVVRPSGPFRLLEGAEYDAARRAANQANAAMRRADPARYAGKQIHEIHPVKFGGSPTDPANKIALTPAEHAEHAKYTVFWNRLMKEAQ